MWKRLGHFVPSRHTGGGREQKRSFYLKNVKRLLLCTRGSALGTHTVPSQGPRWGDEEERRQARTLWATTCGTSMAGDRNPFRGSGTLGMPASQVGAQGSCCSLNRRWPPLPPSPCHSTQLSPAQASQICSLFLGGRAHHRETRVTEILQRKRRSSSVGGMLSVTFLCNLSQVQGRILKSHPAPAGSHPPPITS